MRQKKSNEESREAHRIAVEDAFRKMMFDGVSAEAIPMPEHVRAIAKGNDPNVTEEQINEVTYYALKTSLGPLGVIVACDGSAAFDLTGTGVSAIDLAPELGSLKLNAKELAEFDVAGIPVHHETLTRYFIFRSKARIAELEAAAAAKTQTAAPRTEARRH